MRRIVLAMIVLAALTGCAMTIPTDPQGTLDRVRGGTLRVGVSHHEPQVRWRGEGHEPRGTEPEFVRRFASSLDADVSWTGDAGEEALVSALEDGELDLVIGGLTDRSPWSAQVALTAVYARSLGPDGEPIGHVMAIQQGENAFLVELERFLRRAAG